MSEITPSGLPADKADRVARAACTIFRSELPLQREAVTFAGVMSPIGDGTLDLVLAFQNDEPRRLLDLAYALLLRACADADEAGDDLVATIAGDALETLDDIVGQPAVRTQ